MSSAAQGRTKTTRRHQAAKLQARRLSNSAAKSGAEEDVPEPSFRALRMIAITQGIPFIGFGFMDNAILIIAGELSRCIAAACIPFFPILIHFIYSHISAIICHSRRCHRYVARSHAWNFDNVRSSNREYHIGYLWDCYGHRN